VGCPLQPDLVNASYNESCALDTVLACGRVVHLSHELALTTALAASDLPTQSLPPSTSTLPNTLSKNISPPTPHSLMYEATFPSAAVSTSTSLMGKAACRRFQREQRFLQEILARGPIEPDVRA